MQGNAIVLDRGAQRSISFDVSGTIRRAWSALSQKTQEAIVMNLLVVALMTMVVCLVQAPVVSALMAVAAVVLTWRLNQFPDMGNMDDDHFRELTKMIDGKEVAA